ncbi:hypothetical protein [Actinomadura sp. SCN-SB]|uniref:hypothetical protein n=1 Tax=Actinomadura sp. SCN-SB TaxID=3373092 RepID=UPI003750E4E9
MKQKDETTSRAGAVAHNHQVEPFSPLRPPGQCPRCDARRAERAARGLTDHNHQPLPFGRRLPYGQCPRCDQLHDGAQPRTRHSRDGQRVRDDRQRQQALGDHFAPGGPHDRGECGPVCTAFDW